MSADVSDNAKRLARGEIAVPEGKTCWFCDADALRRTADRHSADPKSHIGLRDTTTWCEECGARFTLRERVQSRLNLPSRPQALSITWDVPDDWVLVYCEDCGGIMPPLVDGGENEELFIRVLDGEKTCSQCDGPYAFAQERLYRKSPDARAHEDAEVQAR